MESNTKDFNLNYKNNISKINLKDGMYKVKDSQINNYLLSKNLKKNRQVSINTKTIKNLDHYIWWLTQKSKLYYFIRNNKIRIYFNHRKIYFKKRNYLCVVGL